MPRLFHQPPKYRLHRSTKQAVVSFFGEVIQLGPYGSARSHKRYQELIGEWHAPCCSTRLSPKERLVLASNFFIY